MHIETFDSPEEMARVIHERRKHALEGLAPAQQSLTFGSHWVQFHDLDNRHIIFGRVATREEVALGELLGPDGTIREGSTMTQVVELVETTEAELDDGMMYGWAYDRFEPAGTLGHTHKAHVWPIEERLFDMAAVVGWDIALLNEAGRFLLEVAFRSMRAHYLPKYRDAQ
jgi:hypothetical protein